MTTRPNVISQIRIRSRLLVPVQDIAEVGTFPGTTLSETGTSGVSKLCRKRRFRSNLDKRAHSVDIDKARPGLARVSAISGAGKYRHKGRRYQLSERHARVFRQPLLASPRGFGRYHARPGCRTIIATVRFPALPGGAGNASTNTHTERFARIIPPVPSPVVRCIRRGIQISEHRRFVAIRK